MPDHEEKPKGVAMGQELTHSQSLFVLSVLRLAERGALYIDVNKMVWVSVRLHRLPEFNPDTLPHDLRAVYDYLFRPWPLRKQPTNVALDFWRDYGADIGHLMEQVGGMTFRLDSVPVTGAPLSEVYRQHGASAGTLGVWLRSVERESFSWLMTRGREVTPRLLAKVLELIASANEERLDPLLA